MAEPQNQSATQSNQAPTYFNLTLCEQAEATLQKAQALADNKAFEEALSVLKQMSCIMGTWMKGKVYQTAAENLANSFTYRYYCTDALIEQYRNFLNEAYDFFCEAAAMLPSASLQIKDFLNPQIWKQIGWCENELARTRPWEPEPQDESPAEEFKKYQEEFINSMVNDFEFWSVKSS